MRGGAAERAESLLRQRMVYDGTFTGVLTAGEGVTAELLRAQGIPVYGESRVAELADPI